MKLFAGFALGLVLCACNSKQEEKPVISTETAKESEITLAGSNYFFAPQFDAEKCEGIAECDCCSSNVLFLDNTRFITICPCESDESVYKGTYKVLNDKVVLNYDTLEVQSVYDWEADIDTTGTVKPSYDIVVSSRDAVTETLDIKKCGGKLYFTTAIDAETFYGTIDKRYSLNQHIQILKKEGLWDKIQPN